MLFRRDVNGLRAIAVIAVVLFHFSPSILPGGFAGVDVFFVISGFLMTGIIFRGFEQNNFSIVKFYIARANRIIPALFVLCITMLMFGFMFLTPIEFKALGKDVGSSIGFFSNFTYWNESGYFDAKSRENWLLHTWSLSVEWQFYIIYPLVLVAMRRMMTVTTIKFVILIGTILGFLFCIIVSYKWASSAYYLLPARAWEMMVGGIAFLYPFKFNNRTSQILESLGLVLVVASYFLVSKETPWPGYVAIFPIIGSFLIIQAQQQNSFLTGNFIFQKLGAWSYSIYLWHWPIVVAIYYFSLNTMFLYWGVFLSILLGFLSNKYVERVKFKGSFTSVSEWLKCKPIQMALFAGILGGIVLITNGLAFIYNPIIQKTIFAHSDLNPRRDQCFDIGKKCIFGEGEVSLILVGDSHALSTVSALSESIANQNKSLQFYGYPNCLTMLGKPINKSSYYCNEFLEWVMADIANNNLPMVIINSGAYPVGGAYIANPTADIRPVPMIDFNHSNFENFDEYYISRQAATFCEINKTRPVYLVRPIPVMQDSLPNYMLKAHLSGTAIEYKVKKTQYLIANDVVIRAQNLAAQKCNVQIIDITRALCDNDFCYGTDNLIPLYSDTNHLTETGSKRLISEFRARLEEAF